MENPDALYFRIKGWQMTFAARISFFIADMLEDDEVMATYKSSRCKMPCHTCMVSQSDLNNINIVLENNPRKYAGSNTEWRGKRFFSAFYQKCFLEISVIITI